MEFCVGVSASETGCDRRQVAVSRIHRTGPGLLDREGAVRKPHEIKFDGYRVQVHLAHEEVKVYTRRGNDWTKRFKKVANDAWHVKAGSAIIDGEIVVPAADGTTDFSVLQNELKGKSTSIVLVAFDLLYLNGRDIRKLPLVERKAELKKIIAGTEVQLSESFEIERRALRTFVEWITSELTQTHTKA